MVVNLLADFESVGRSCGSFHLPVWTTCLCYLCRPRVLFAPASNSISSPQEGRRSLRRWQQVAGIARLERHAGQRIVVPARLWPFAALRWLVFDSTRRAWGRAFEVLHPNVLIICFRNVELRGLPLAAGRNKLAAFPLVHDQKFQA
jgi:hypothetical protein